MEENNYKTVEYIFINFLKVPVEFKMLFPERYLNRKYFGVKEIIKYKNTHKNTVNLYILPISIIHNLIDFLKLNVECINFNKLNLYAINVTSSDPNGLFFLEFHIPSSVNKKTRLINTFEFLITTESSTLSTITLLFYNGKKI